MTARRFYQLFSLHTQRSAPTILNFPYPSLHIVQGQVADLGLEAVEIHKGQWGGQNASGTR